MKRNLKNLLGGASALLLVVSLVACEPPEDDNTDMIVAGYLLTQEEAAPTTSLSVPETVLTETQGSNAAITSSASAASTAASSSITISSSIAPVAAKFTSRKVAEIVRRKVTEKVLKSSSVHSLATTNVPETALDDIVVDTEVYCGTNSNNETASGTVTGTLTNVKLSGSSSATTDNPYNFSMNVSYKMEGFTATYSNCVVSAWDLSDQSALSNLAFSDSIPMVDVELDGTMTMTGNYSMTQSSSEEYNESAVTVDNSDRFNLNQAVQASSTAFQVDNGEEVAFDMSLSTKFAFKQDVTLAFGSLDELSTAWSNGYYYGMADSVSGSASQSMTISFSGTVGDETPSGTIVISASANQDELNEAYVIGE